MPDFGGPFGKLPEPYNSKLKEYQVFKRNSQPRLRVQPPPRRWR
ncbi:unnamed protein product [Schistosoma curassoni]|nr:unnamed protein product [Schistosoma curassoni]